MNCFFVFTFRILLTKTYEYSEVEADIKGNVISIKNPKSGTITVDSVGEIINEDSIMDVNGKVIIRNEK